MVPPFTCGLQTCLLFQVVIEKEPPPAVVSAHSRIHKHVVCGFSNLIKPMHGTYSTRLYPFFTEKILVPDVALSSTCVSSVFTLVQVPNKLR